MHYYQLIHTHAHLCKLTHSSSDLWYEQLLIRQFVISALISQHFIFPLGFLTMGSKMDLRLAFVFFIPIFQLEFHLQHFSLGLASMVLTFFIFLLSTIPIHVLCPFSLVRRTVYCCTLLYADVGGKTMEIP